MITELARRGAAACWGQAAWAASFPGFGGCDIAASAERQCYL